MTRTCCICEKDDVLYKCPTCRQPYCSVSCYKKHKIQPCEPPEIPEKTDTPRYKVKYEFSTEDTVPPEKLQELRRSEELKSCLRNPYLRDIMKGILNSKNPTNAIALAMKEPLFVEMADACLKVIEPQEKLEVPSDL